MIFDGPMVKPTHCGWEEQHPPHFWMLADDLSLFGMLLRIRPCSGKSKSDEESADQ